MDRARYTRGREDRESWLCYNLPSCLSGIAHPWFWTTLSSEERRLLTSGTPKSWSLWKAYLLDNFKIPRDTAETLLHQQRYSQIDALNNRNIQVYTQRVRRFTTLAEQPPSFVARNMWDQIEKALVIPYFDRPPVGYDSRKLETALRDKQETWHLWQKDRVVRRQPPPRPQIQQSRSVKPLSAHAQPPLPPIHIHVPRLAAPQRDVVRSQAPRQPQRPGDYVPDHVFRNMTPAERQKLMDEPRASQARAQQRVTQPQRAKLLTNVAGHEQRPTCRRPSQGRQSDLRLRRRFVRKDDQGNLLMNTAEVFDVDNGDFQYDLSKEEELEPQGYFPADDELLAAQGDQPFSDHDPPDDDPEPSQEEPAPEDFQEDDENILDEVSLFVLESEPMPKSSADANLYSDKYIYSSSDLTCYGCGVVFSTSKGYKTHLSSCALVTARRSTRPSPWQGPLLRPSLAADTSPDKGCGYTYARVQTRGSVNGPVITACYNTGASRCAISRSYLDYFPDAKIDWKPKAYVRGVGRTKAEAWAEFTMYHQANVKGHPMILALRIGAWVLDHLEVGLLIGQEFMVPHKVDVLNSTGEISFGCFQGARYRPPSSQKSHPELTPLRPQRTSSFLHVHTV